MHPSILLAGRPCIPEDGIGAASAHRSLHRPQHVVRADRAGASMCTLFPESQGFVRIPRLLTKLHAHRLHMHCALRDDRMSDSALW